jgi:DMSO reductase anchor subunit
MASSGSGRRWSTAAAAAAHRTLGRRRSWLLLSQCLVVAGLVGMALTDPRQALGPVVACALMVAFGSATQDIALDAFRIESADANHQAPWLPPTRRATGWR